VFFGCLKQAAGLFNRENALFAKDITTFCQFAITDKGKHFTNQEVDVPFSVPMPFPKNMQEEATNTSTS